MTNIFGEKYLDGEPLLCRLRQQEPGADPAPDEALRHQHNLHLGTPLLPNLSGVAVKKLFNFITDAVDK
jgi:hypothetical protein